MADLDTARESAPPITNHESRITTGESRIMVRRLGMAAYLDTWQAMKAFTDARTTSTVDELWLLQHPAVYTYGVAGRIEHLPRTETGIPVVKVDRGGQVTYHGPGQIVAYALLDLRRRGMTIRELVRKLEQAVLHLLAEFSLTGERSEGAPGVYVGGAKIAALGLRIRNSCSYHGLSFNVDMDLSPFRAIDPCGYPDMPVTQLRDLGVHAPIEHVADRLLSNLLYELEPQLEVRDSQ